MNKDEVMEEITYLVKPVNSVVPEYLDLHIRKLAALLADILGRVERLERKPGDVVVADALIARLDGEGNRGTVCANGHQFEDTGLGSDLCPECEAPWKPSSVN